MESLIPGFFLFFSFFGLARWLVGSLFIEPMPLIVKAQSPHHRTARGFPVSYCWVLRVKKKKKRRKRIYILPFLFLFLKRKVLDRSPFSDIYIFFICRLYFWFSKKSLIKSRSIDFLLEVLGFTFRVNFCVWYRV